jgi:outer membrane protein TolC
VAAKARQVEKVRNDLTRNLADSFERYENGRQQIALYRDLILPDLVRAFRGTFDRFQVEPDKLSYGDISSAQQNLMSQITSYLQALSVQWQAVADLTAAVQSDDPYKLSEGLDPAMSFEGIDGPKRIPERR